MKKYVITGIVLSLLGGLWLLMGPITIRTTEIEFIDSHGVNIPKVKFRAYSNSSHISDITEGPIFDYHNRISDNYRLNAAYIFDDYRYFTSINLETATIISNDGMSELDVTSLEKHDPDGTYYFPPRYIPYTEMLSFSWPKLPITLGVNTLVLKGNYCEASGCTEFSSEIKFRIYEHKRYSTRTFEIAIGV